MQSWNTIAGDLKMIRQQRSRDIDVTPETVWAEISRYMHINEFAPFVDSVDALSDRDSGVGAKRRCNFDNGSSMVEEVIAWTPNRGYRVRASEMDPMPLHEAVAELSVTPLGNGRATVTWSMDYRVKYGPLGWLMGQTMMKMMMGKVLDANLKGLADKLAPADAQLA